MSNKKLFQLWKKILVLRPNSQKDNQSKEQTRFDISENPLSCGKVKEKTWPSFSMA